MRSEIRAAMAKLICAQLGEKSLPFWDRELAAFASEPATKGDVDQIRDEMIREVRKHLMQTYVLKPKGE